MDEEQEQSRLELMLKLSSEFKDESDRAAAVLFAAYLDHLLGELIAAYMAVEYDRVDKLLYKDGHGPLGTFAARINTTHCLGLLSEDEYSDLNIIRRIRNDFAHKLVGLTFEYQSIADRCRNLKGAQVGGRPATARESFKKAAIRLMVDIILRIQDKTGNQTY